MLYLRIYKNNANINNFYDFVFGILLEKNIMYIYSRLIIKKRMIMKRFLLIMFRERIKLWR